jgi:hypothetical protein
LRKLGAASVAASLLLAMVMMACHSNPDIKGSTVATVGSPTDIPTCAQICNRLAALCGYAPVDCTDADAGGYCDTQITDPTELVCIGYGSLKDPDAGTYTLTQSCQAAWACIAAGPTSSGDDSGSTDDSGDDTDDGGDLDGASE